MVFQDDNDAIGELAATDTEKPRKHKIRGVWISFVGRMMAQVLGAIASITLGVIFMQKYQNAQAAVPSATPVVGRVAADRPAAPAIAVLPLANFSGGAGDDHLADGITEAITAELAGLDGLRVISRTSSMRYKTPGKSVPEIAREMKVDLVVEGSIVKAGEWLRITAQLIDALSDEHLWAGTYDRRAADVLATQTDVARAIAAEVGEAARSAARSRITLQN